MQPETPVESEAALDHEKLLGFRNLAEVVRTEHDLEAGADEAFQKRGVETGPA